MDPLVWEPALTTMIWYAAEPPSWSSKSQHPRQRMAMKSSDIWNKTGYRNLHYQLDMQSTDTILLNRHTRGISFQSVTCKSKMDANHQRFMSSSLSSPGNNSRQLLKLCSISALACWSRILICSIIDRAFFKPLSLSSYLLSLLSLSRFLALFSFWAFLKELLNWLWRFWISHRLAAAAVVSKNSASDVKLCRLARISSRHGAESFRSAQKTSSISLRPSSRDASLWRWSQMSLLSDKRIDTGSHLSLGGTGLGVTITASQSVSVSPPHVQGARTALMITYPTQVYHPCRPLNSERQIARYRRHTMPFLCCPQVYEVRWWVGARHSHMCFLAADIVGSGKSSSEGRCRSKGT